MNAPVPSLDGADELAGALQRVRAEREELARQLRERDALYDSLVELSGQFPFVTGPEGRVRWVDPRWSELTGRPPEAALGYGFLRAIHLDDRPSRIRGWLAAMRSQRPFEHEHRLCGRYGGYRWVRVRAVPHVLAGSGETRWHGTVEDIEAHRSADASAREAEERYRLAARATRDVIWDHDLLRDELRLAETAATLIGEAPPADVISPEWWLERLHPDDRSAVLDEYSAACAGGESRWQYEFRVRRADGYATILARAFIVRDATGQAVRAVGAMVDLSAQREAEAQLNKLQAELILASRAGAMGMIASMLAHELNQPLTAISNYVRGARRLLLAGGEAAVERSAEALEAAGQSALSAGEIVRRLRALVSRGEGTAAMQSLSQLVEEACGMALLDAPQWRIAVRTDLDPAADRVIGDRVQVQQVLVNLIRNAVDAMRGQDRGAMEIASRIEGQCVEVSVTDSGPGFDPALGARLFEPFVSSKRGGMGIGLSICRAIIEANGGQIWADRGKDGGAVFRFTLPLALEEGEG